MDFPARLYNALLWIREESHTLAICSPADSAEETLVGALVRNPSIANEESLGIRPDDKTARGVKHHARDTSVRQFTSWIVHRVTEEGSLYEADKDRLHEIDQTHGKLEIERGEILARMIKRRKGVEKLRWSISGLLPP